MVSHLGLVNYSEFQEISNSTILWILVAAEMHMFVCTMLYTKSRRAY